MDRRLREELRRLGGAADPEALRRVARDFEREGELSAAASAYDAAYGVEPDDEALGAARARVLDALSLEELGLTWRYVPAGTFLMGSEAGDPDERPVHAVDLEAYWICDVPLSWERYYALAGRPAPPAWNREGQGLTFPRLASWEAEEWKTRVPFCDDRFHRREEVFEWDRDDATYRTKPVVAVTWTAARLFGEFLSGEEWTYRLPSEAEWEKAARGGRVGARYPWGDEAPRPGQIDCEAVGRMGILPSRDTPANGYGLHAMCGGVWEWTSDYYDSTWYREPSRGGGGPPAGEGRVVRGGSWADAAGVCTVSFRATIEGDGLRSRYMTPTLGFRLVRVPAPVAASEEPGA